MTFLNSRAMPGENDPTTTLWRLSAAGGDMIHLAIKVRENSLFL
jgi:hypothetical protein